MQLAKGNELTARAGFPQIANECLFHAGVALKPKLHNAWHIALCHYTLPQDAVIG